MTTEHYWISFASHGENRVGFPETTYHQCASCDLVRVETVLHGHPGESRSVYWWRGECLETAPSCRAANEPKVAA